MPWKERYTISDERSLTDAQVRWPTGMQCCVNVTVDLSPRCGPEGITAADLANADAYYGLHGGLDALRAVLSRHQIIATFAVPAVIAEIYPATMRSLLAEGHEIAAHGLRHEDVSGLDPAEEQRRLDETTGRIATVTGKRPAGWFSLPRQGDKFAVGMISPNTMELLRTGGYDYMGNSPADDIPHYWVIDAAARRCMLVLPYYYHFDDQFFLLFPAKGTGLENPDSLARNWRAELDAQYKRGRCFSMTLHPYAIAWPNRLQMLDQFLTYLRTLPGLWNVTGSACARHWRETFPPETTLRLEDSIWQDHPGSLS